MTNTEKIRKIKLSRMHVNVIDLIEAEESVLEHFWLQLDDKILDFFKTHKNDYNINERIVHFQILIDGSESDLGMYLTVRVNEVGMITYLSFWCYNETESRFIQNLQKHSRMENSKVFRFNYFIDSPVGPRPELKDLSSIYTYPGEIKIFNFWLYKNKFQLILSYLKND